MTSYPYEGDVTITTETEGRYAIAARIPGWCRKYDILVNGCKAEFRLEKGYAYVERDWKAGDSLQLKYSMETRLVEANPKVIDACGRAAVMYGPVSYTHLDVYKRQGQFLKNWTNQYSFIKESIPCFVFL